MKRFACLIVVFFIFGLSPAGAGCTDSWEAFGNCVISGPSAGQGMPEDRRLMSISHSSRTAMNKGDMYGVTIQCSVSDVTNNVGWNPFVAENLVTSHVVALTTSKLAQADLPTADKSRATITVFSAAGDDRSRKVFLNKNCKSSFLVSGREALFLAATANQTTTNTPGPLTRVIYEAIQVAIPILPLIKGTALASTIVGDVAKTEDPLKKVIAELDKGRTYTKSDDLFVGDNIIRTPYSRVNVRVSKIKSLLDPSNADFLKIFEDATDAAQASMALSSAATPSQKCGEFSTGLKGRNFSSPDIAYALVLASQAANLTRSNTLECMSSRYALEALDGRILPAWNRYNGTNYTAADAISHFATTGGSVIAQPRFDRWAVQLRILVQIVGGYLQSGGTQTVDWSRYYTDPVHLTNTTSYYSAVFGESDPPLADVLAALVEKKFRRAGCLTSDTDALAAFVLFRSSDETQKQFKPAETAVMRVWFNEKQRVSRLQIDYDVDLLEKALNGRRARICGEDLEVLAPT